MARRWLGVELFKAIHTFVGSEYDIRVIFKFYHWQDDSYSQRSRKTNVELRYQYTQWRSENNSASLNITVTDFTGYYLYRRKMISRFLPWLSRGNKEWLMVGNSVSVGVINWTRRDHWHYRRLGTRNPCLWLASRSDFSSPLIYLFFQKKRTDGCLKFKSGLAVLLWRRFQ